MIEQYKIQGMPTNIFKSFMLLFCVLLCSQQSTNESWLRDLTQYFGINNRFESLTSKEGTPKVNYSSEDKTDIT